MLKSRTKRLLLATFGSIGIAAGTATPAVAAKFLAALNGDNLVAGDRDGWGRARLNVSPTFNTVCADIEVRGVGRVTSVDVYRGGPGIQGQPVVHLDRPGGDMDSEDCDHVGDALTDDILTNPNDFYVMVRTDAFPHGALRGQLIPASD